MRALQTQRLVLSELSGNDAAFIVELLNDPDWLRYIGDKNVRTLDGARAYVENGPKVMYVKRIGLWRVALNASDTPIGLCGLIKRDSLPELDLGFAFLPQFRGQGYAREAAQACVEYACDVLKAPRLLAITSLDNERSGRLLEAVGLRFDKIMPLPPDNKPVRLYAKDYGLSAEGSNRPSATTSFHASSNTGTRRP